MRYVEYLTFACFVAGVLMAAIGFSTIGLYLFAAAVALAILRSIAAEAEKQSGQPPQN